MVGGAETIARTSLKKVDETSEDIESSLEEPTYVLEPIYMSLGK